MKPFRERNLVVIGLLGFTAIALLLLAAFRADRPVRSDVLSNHSASSGVRRTVSV